MREGLALKDDFIERSREMLNTRKTDRVRAFTMGALVAAGAGVMLGNVQARNDNISPTQANKMRAHALEYFVTQSEDGMTAYFWQLDVARGKAGKMTDVLQADALLVGVGEVDSGGGLNQTDIDRTSGERTLFLEGLDGVRTIDNR
jgi:hypothetical protein